MRIIAGRFRGRTLLAPPGRTTRPTTDRVRESMFSAIQSAGDGFDGAAVLDAFAGSGALGLEALSRGAARATFVERDRRALSALSANIESLGVGREATVVRADLFSLANRGVPGGPFSLLLLDPPYTLDAALVAGFVGGIATAGGLAEGALCVWEHAEGDTPAWPGGFEIVRRKRYGSTEVDFAIKQTEAGES